MTKHELQELKELIDNVADAYFECGEAPTDTGYQSRIETARKAKTDLVAWVETKIRTHSETAVDSE